MSRSFFVGVCLVLVIFFGGSYAAQAAFSQDQIPPQLIPWQEWVLHGQQENLCPHNYNDAAVVRCRWPSRLSLEITDNGAEFEQRWLLFAEGWAPLPGSPSLWPESVAVNGQSAAVILRDNSPAVRLPAGEHRVKGRFSWVRKPELIHVSPALGLLSVSIDGRSIRVPVLDESGRLWLQEGRIPDGDMEAVDGRIFRLLDDTIPMQVRTLLRLNVSGKGREIHIESVSIPNSMAMALESELPARLHHDGRLIVQARAGQWEIRIHSRMSGPQHKIGAGAMPLGEEIWSFQPRPALRLVEILDVPRIDPGQTEMPAEWRGLPAFVVKPDSTMIIKELRRGDPEPAPDQLSLQRTWWLDFDGGGFTVQDSITGTLNRQWSLAMNPPMLLGRVVADEQERVITQQGPDHKRGIELRQGRLQLHADSRLPVRTRTLSAVAWDHDFQGVSGVLHLPPGWRLWAASGVDHASDTWVQRWSLLDFFLVLIIATGVAKLRSRLWGLTALAAMILMFQEPGAPRLVWLHLLAVLALMPLLPTGWIKRLVGLWGIAAMLVLLVTVVPFVVQQIRWGVYPQLAQLESPHRPLPYATDQALLMSEELPARSPAPARAKRETRVDTTDIKPLQEQDPEALIPTGPGLPEWRWRSVDLRWSGPVAKEQTMTLYLMSPALNLFLALMRVGLLMVLVWSLIDWRSWRERMRKIQAAGAAAALLGLCSAGVLLPDRAAAAPDSFPPPALLEEWSRRLLEKPDCLPHCADISRMEVVARDDSIQVILKIHCAVPTAVPLPVNRTSWVPDQILLNNAPISGLARDDQGRLWAMIAAGQHTLALFGDAGGEGVIMMPLPLRPRLASYSVQGWGVSGIHPDGQVGSALQLSRLQTDHERPGEVRTSELTPFLQVVRVLNLGLSWRTTTTVRRLTPLGTPILISLPLLEGESVTTPGISVEQGQVLVNMAPDQREVTYVAGLKTAPVLELEAPRAVPWTETWILDASVVWHTEFEGIPVVHHQDALGQRRPQWQPWAGEKLAIHIRRPLPAAGQTKTIDQADLVLTPGQRFGQGQLALNIRTSRGAQHTIGLPPQANLQQVRVNNQSLPVRQDGNYVTIPLQPGSQRVQVHWLQSTPFTTGFKAPPINIGQSAVNARVTLNMPDQRWILLVGGPRWGPAVLFWSYLLAIVLAAVVLGRLAPTPLKTRHWVLLGLGLTQIPVEMGLVIVGCLGLLGLRDRQPMPGGRLAFNTIQIGLVVLTLAALAALFEAVRAGLLGQPDMQIAGNQSTHMILNWTQDHISEQMPQPWVISLPIWVFRLLMLAWSLWLAQALLVWFKWGWHSLNRDGLWRKKRVAGDLTIR